MNKKIIVFVFSLLLMACGDDVETNTPSIQGEANNQFFHALNSQAMENINGGIILKGSAGIQKITLQVNSQEPGVYDLSEAGNKATFQTDSIFYSTDIMPGNGQVEITKQENGTLYGSFYFNAFSSGQKDTLVFERGDFFKVPLQTTGEDDLLQ